MSDLIDKAIEAAAAKPVEVKMHQIQITIASTGRPAILAIPVDATDGEVAELAGWMLTDLLKGLRAERAKTAGGRIIIPAGTLLPGHP